MRARVGQAVLVTASVWSAWCFFQLLAHTLMALPTDFHLDPLWQQLGVGIGDDD